jgi:hypothetical protein
MGEVPYKSTVSWLILQKHTRIEALEPYFTNGQLLFLTSWNQDYPLLIELSSSSTSRLLRMMTGWMR